MRTALEYMAVVPEQFKGERETQRVSNQRAAEKVEPRKTLDWMIKQVIGSEAIGLGQIRQWIARQVNPAESYATLLIELDDLRAVSSVNDAQWEEFLDSMTEFLSTLDESNSEALTHPDRWAEIDVESNDWSDPELDPYMESQFAKDVERDTFADDAKPGTDISRGVYLTDGCYDFPTYTVGATNWGFYNEAATEGYRRELMRMRWFANMFLVGGVQIKSDGLAKCGVSGCRWSHQLASNSVEGSTVFDRRYAEYQTLLILAHLGEHTRKNPANYWQPIDRVNRGRDTASMKLDSASESQSGNHPHYRVRLLKVLVD